MPLYAEAPAPEAGDERVAAAVSPHLPISVLLLGMGDDMHTASLFPGADRLAEALAPDAPILMPMRAAAAGEPRVTLTARVSGGCNGDPYRHHRGPIKRAAIERARPCPLEEAPIRAVSANATVHWAP